MISTNSAEKSMNDWFLFEATDDASFTMRFINSESGSASECMHSLRGAFSETNYIYGHAMRTSLSLGLEPSFLSVGLGLGYCETLLTALMLQAGKSYYAESFEVDARLREQFSNWLRGQSVHSEFQKVYDQTLKSSAELCGIEFTQLKMHLQDSQIEFRNLLTSDTTFIKKFSCILFDAFSSKSTPELWTQEFLENFFEKACAPKCIFATYACTGILKRALKNSGFDFEIRPGFSSKRDSTFAIRK